MDNWNRREALGNRQQKESAHQPSTPLSYVRVRIALPSKIAATPQAANASTTSTESNRVNRQAEDAALLRADCAGGHRLAPNVAHRFEQKGVAVAIGLGGGRTHSAKASLRIALS
jgi:hypothetical protein